VLARDHAATREGAEEARKARERLKQEELQREMVTKAQEQKHALSPKRAPLPRNGQPKGSRPPPSNTLRKLCREASMSSQEMYASAGFADPSKARADAWESMPVSEEQFATALRESPEIVEEFQLQVQRRVSLPF